MFRLITIGFSQKSPHFSLLSPTSPSNLKVVGALDKYSLVFAIFIKFFGQLKDWVGQVLFLVSCPKGQVEKCVNVEAWRVAVFHWPAKVWYPCMAWTSFINRPKTSRPWLYLTKHHKMSKRKLSFPDQSSIANWLIKEKKDILETLSVPLLDDIKLKSQIINL
jgi:hypothetical protein